MKERKRKTARSDLWKVILAFAIVIIPCLAYLGLITVACPGGSVMVGSLLVGGIIFGLMLFLPIFAFWIEYDMLPGYKKFIFVVLAVLVTVNTGALCYHYDKCSSYEAAVVDNYDIWYCNTPFGKYWVDISGGTLYFSGELKSSLTETYTIKYLVNNELCTLMIRSTDVGHHIIFSYRNSSFYVSRVRGYDVDAYDGRGVRRSEFSEEWYIYIPDPKVCEQADRNQTVIKDD